MNLLRKLPSSSEDMVDFVSNDYLGLARNPFVQQKTANYYKETHQQIGTGGSRLLAGNNQYFEDLETQLAIIHHAESALLFNAGYVANMAFFVTIPQKGDTILYDSLIHACVKDGIRLSVANRYSFRHNNLTHLEKRLQKAEGNIFVAVESIYSMDGDASPLEELVDLCQKYQAYLVVDEAHSTGVFGENGAGLVCALGLENHVFARIHTFGKGIGAHGACIVGSQVLKDYLVNFSRQFIYTTSAPVHSLLAIRSAYEVLKAQTHLQKELEHKIQLFKNNFKNTFVESHSPIQVVLCKGNDYVREVAQKLQNRGFDIRPIMSPTVPEGTERLRICLHVHNTDQEIINLATALTEIICQDTL
ncbi:MAG: pyridoxal phosphate-dependent aminotransferase family protein [Cytophagales bacterium]|nr:pyridoxal phosphate-dependent aminotransferase family protein [Cytophagales bacterium]